MERIVYRITLDAHKNGIQRTLQGFETFDRMSRRIAINITAGGDTYEIPFDHVAALIYITTPNAKEPSIDECVIEDNTIVYDVPTIVEEGITEMQLKLIDSRIKGANAVLMSARFAVEVTSSSASDSDAEQSPFFTALENAVAQAKSAYDSSLDYIEIDDDLTFRALYKDKRQYVTDVLSKAIYEGNAKLSQSWAIGQTGAREGEDTDNSKYYSSVAQSAAEAADLTAKNTQDLYADAAKKSVYTMFGVDYNTGELMYHSGNYDFGIDPVTGQLVVDGGKDYQPEDVLGDIVDNFIDSKSAEMDAEIEEAKSIALGKNQARVFDTEEDMIDWLSDPNNKGLCSIGDNLYIKELHVPDWWVSEVYDLPDSDGKYYGVSQLETQSINVADYETYINRMIDLKANVRYSVGTDMIQVRVGDEWKSVYKAYAHVLNIAKMPAEEWTKTDIASVAMTNDYLLTKFEYGVTSATNKEGYAETDLYDMSGYTAVNVKAKIYGFAASQGTNTLKIQIVDNDGAVVKEVYSFTTTQSTTQNTFETTVDSVIDVSDVDLDINSTGKHRIRVWGSVFGNWSIAAEFTEFYMS